MIIYKYSLKEDLRWSFRTIKNLKWLKKHNLKIFYPNLFRMILLWFKKPKINFQTTKDITCYWIHAGTWGSYTPPNKIFICPWKIAQAGGLQRVIEHEITHLEYEPSVKGMTHEEKEKFINNQAKL